jgi:adenylate cyclase
LAKAREWVERVPGGRWTLLALAFALLLAADYVGPRLGALIDQRAGDVLLRLHAPSRPVSERVAIVDIDQRSLEQMNDLAGSWPWPRSVHGELIDWIERQHPRAIVFDVLFNELDVYRPEHDAAFADAVARNSNVLLAMTLNSDGDGAPMKLVPAAAGARPLTDPPADVRVPLMLPLAVADHPEAMRGGLINFHPDSDGIGRHHYLYLDRKGWRFPSLPARVARETGRSLPDRQAVLLNWRRGWTHLSYADLYLDSLRGRPLRPQGELTGKIVVVGTSAPGLLDLRATPLGSTYPGVEILATAIDNLDRGDWLREAPRPWLIPLALAMIAGAAFGFARGVAANRIGLALLGVTIVALAAAWFALAAGTFVPVFGALAFGWLYYLAASAAAYLIERAQRLRTFGMFKRFLDPRVVSQLIESGEIDWRSNAQAREISVLFTDIRGFTSLSEAIPPEEVVAMLNSYFEQQVEVVFEHGGTLDKFIGDAVMAFWGAPVANPDHAKMAVTAALAMSDTLERWRASVGATGRDLDIGIGIHSGSAVVGFIGSRERLDYTAIGDTVNLASRIEGQTKGRARVLVSEATRALAGDAFDWRDHGTCQVKGREQEVRLFEPLPKRV